MDMTHLRYKAFWLIFFLIQTHCADKYTDQNRPYEFGFKIDGQQDRHEKKDSNGIIMGEFGFITADDVYHVTVYATDAQGRFKILSMKNIHLKDTKSVTSVRQGHSLQIPSTHQVPAVQVTTTTTTQPIKQIAQEFQPVSLEPPVNSCSHCSLPTTSTAAPKPLLSISQPNGNINYNITETENSAKVGQKTKSQIYPSESNNYSPNTATLKNQQNSPSVASEEQGYPQKLESSQNYPTQGINNQNYPSVSQYQSYPTAEKNYPSVSGTQQSYAPQSTNEGQNAPETKQIPVNQIYTQETQKNSLPQGAQSYLNQQQNYATASGTQQISSPQEIHGEQNYLKASREQNYLQETPKNNLPEENLNYPQGVGTQQNYQPNSESNQYNRAQEGIDNFQPTKEQRNSINSSKFTSQTADKSNVGSTETNNQGNGLSQNGVEQTPKEISPGGNVPVYRTPKQFNNENKPASVLSGQKPSLAYAQMQIVDKNTNIHAKAPGEKDGLPPGLSENDMVRLLYTFNYTLGFQGHFEEGYSNGVKQGYYFVTGRNGVRTRVDYVADDKGFRPKISQDVLDLLSDDVPKPETEKQAKYGLKGYEFKWLYFPQDSKKR